MRLKTYLIERNVVNVKEIENDIKNFIRREAITDLHIKKWFKNTFRKWLINDFNLHSIIKYDLKDPKIASKINLNNTHWQTKALKRGEILYKIEHPYLIIQNIGSHLLDYFEAHPNLRIQRISVPEAQRQA